MTTRELFTAHVERATAKRNREHTTYWVMVEDSAQIVNPSYKVWRWYHDLDLTAEMTFAFDHGKLSIDTVIEKRSWPYERLREALQYIDEFLGAEA